MWVNFEIQKPLLTEITVQLNQEKKITDHSTQRILGIFHSRRMCFYAFRSQSVDDKKDSKTTSFSRSWEQSLIRVLTLLRTYSGCIISIVFGSNSQKDSHQPKKSQYLWPIASKCAVCTWSSRESCLWLQKGPFTQMEEGSLVVRESTWAIYWHFQIWSSRTL